MNNAKTHFGIKNLMQNRKWNLLLFFILGALYIVAFRPVTDWIYTHWLFNYEYEFIKRGLVGELIRLSGVHPSYTLVLILSLLISVSLAVYLITFFHRPFKSDGNKAIGTYFFFIVCITHSATIQRFFFDTGRFDHLLYILFLGIIFLFQKVSWNKSVLIVLVLSVIGLLIHEAYFFISLPLTFVLWFKYYKKNHLRLAVMIIIGIILIGVTWYIGTFGRIYSMTFSQYLQLLVSQYGERVELASLAVLYRGLNENLEYATYWLLNLSVFIHSVFFLVTMVPTALLFWKLIKKDLYEWKTNKEAELKCIAYVIAFSPLALLPFGFDVFRWWALAITNMFIIITLFSAEKTYRERISKSIEKNLPLTFMVIAISLILGPVAVTGSYPWFIQVLEILGF